MEAAVFLECNANDSRECDRYKDFLIGLIRLLWGVTLIPLIRLYVCVVFVELINPSKGGWFCLLELISSHYHQGGFQLDGLLMGV